MTAPTLTRKEQFGKIVLFCIAFVLFVYSFFLESLGYTRIAVGFLLVFFVGTIARLIYYPYQRAFLESSTVRPVDESRKVEFERILGRNGVETRGIWVADDLGRSYGFAQIHGLLPKNRHLFLDADFFDRYTPRERRAVVERESKLATSYYSLFSSMIPYLVLIGYFFLEASFRSWQILSRWPLGPEILALILLIGGVWTTRQKVYHADEFAAERTSPETVVSVLETFATEKSESDRERGKIAVLSWFWTRPSPSRRIERVRKRKERTESDD